MLCLQGQVGAVAAADPANAVAPAFECMRRSDLTAWFPNAHLRCTIQQQFSTALQHLATAREAAAAPPEPAPAAPPTKPPAPRVCANPDCGATAGKLRRCGGCAAVRYCSEACSCAHWRAHKAECRQLVAERQAVEAAGRGSGGASTSGGAP